MKNLQRQPNYIIEILLPTNNSEERVFAYLLEECFSK